MLVMKGHKLLIKLRAVEDALNAALKANPDLERMGFKIALSASQQKQEKIGTAEGKIVAIGNMAWKDPELGYGLDGWEPWAEVGDRILFTRYAGKFVQDPSVQGEEGEFYIINDVDMQCIVKD